MIADSHSQVSGASVAFRYGMDAVPVRVRCVSAFLAPNINHTYQLPTPSKTSRQWLVRGAVVVSRHCHALSD